MITATLFPLASIMPVMTVWHHRESRNEVMRGVRSKYLSASGCISYDKLDMWSL
jgi:hypothetical protein